MPVNSKPACITQALDGAFVEHVSETNRFETFTYKNHDIKFKIHAFDGREISTFVQTGEKIIEIVVLDGQGQQQFRYFNPDSEAYLRATLTLATLTGEAVRDGVPVQNKLLNYLSNVPEFQEKAKTIPDSDVARHDLLTEFGKKWLQTSGTVNLQNLNPKGMALNISSDGRLEGFDFGALQPGLYKVEVVVVGAQGREYRSALMSVTP